MSEKYILDILWLLVSSGLLSWGLLMLKKLIDKHMHNQKYKAGIDLAIDQARGLVARYANSSHVPTFERRDAVLHDLSVYLDEQGHPKTANDTKFLVGQIESAYQKYKANGGDIHDAKKADAMLNPTPVATQKADDKK